MASKVRVLVVEDCQVSRDFLVHLLHSDPDLEVIGAANDGQEALDFIQRNPPDVIAMDIHMPRMSGFETTRRIMETQPIPVVMVTASTDPGEVATLFEAMDAGALAVLSMPTGIGHPNHKETSRELIQTLKAMSEVKVVRRWAHKRKLQPAPPIPLSEERKLAGTVQIIAIGASTGGPPILQTLLQSLPAGFPVPIVIVQHIAAGFLTGFVEWLSSACQIRVQIAIDGESLRPGYAYIAPDNVQMCVTPDHAIVLRNDPPENGLRPAISALFRSVAEVFGPNAVGVLLTGMGKDGAAEMKRIKSSGGVTIAQSKETCVVHGMPGEAVRLEAVTYVLTPEEITSMFIDIARKQ